MEQKPILRIGDDNMCPVTGENCDDETCSPGAECNVSGDIGPTDCNPEDTLCEKKDVYPIGGYAPGNYYRKCSSCGELFHGDKRSFECERCGRHSECIRLYIIEVLQFVSDKHDLKLTGEDILNEYLKDVFKKFIESDYYKKVFPDNENNKAEVASSRI